MSQTTPHSFNFTFFQITIVTPIVSMIINNNKNNNNNNK